MRVGFSFSKDLALFCCKLGALSFVPCALKPLGGVECVGASAVPSVFLPAAVILVSFVPCVIKTWELVCVPPLVSDSSVMVLANAAAVSLAVFCGAFVREGLILNFAHGHSGRRCKGEEGEGLRGQCWFAAIQR